MNKPISASLGLKIFLGKHIRGEVFREFFPSRCPKKRLVYRSSSLQKSGQSRFRWKMICSIPRRGDFPTIRQSWRSRRACRQHLDESPSQHALLAQPKSSGSDYGEVAPGSRSGRGYRRDGGEPRRLEAADRDGERAPEAKPNQRAKTFVPLESPCKDGLRTKRRLFVRVVQTTSQAFQRGLTDECLGCRQTPPVAPAPCSR